MSAAQFAALAGEYQLAPGFILSVRSDGQRFITQATDSLQPGSRGLLKDF